MEHRDPTANPLQLSLAMNYDRSIRDEPRCQCEEHSLPWPSHQVTEHDHADSPLPAGEEEAQKGNPEVFAVREADISSSKLFRCREGLLDVRTGETSGYASSSRTDTPVHDPRVHGTGQFDEVAAGTAHDESFCLFR